MASSATRTLNPLRTMPPTDGGEESTNNSNSTDAPVLYTDEEEQHPLEWDENVASFCATPWRRSLRSR